MIDRKELSKYVLARRNISVPELMLERGLSYGEAREFVSDLEKAGVVKSVGNMDYEIEKTIQGICRIMLDSNDKRLKALLNATKDQYEGLRAVFSNAKSRSSEFTMMAMRRCRNMMDSDVWDWLVKNGVINDEFVLTMDRNEVLSVITYLKAFVYD